MSIFASSYSEGKVRLASPEAQARARFGYLLTKIASGEPAPASGSASAAVVAAAEALAQKVAIRSERWSRSTEIHNRAEAVRLRAEELVELDAAAFNEFLAAVRSGGDVEAARQKTIDVPLEIARAGAEVVQLSHELESGGNQNLRADAVAAAILAHSAVTVAAMLVKINLTPGAGDARSREAGRLVREVSASVRQQAARAQPDGRGRGGGRSRDNGPQSRPRTGRGGPSGRSAAPRRAT